jgi:hypothetical protein
VVEFLQSTFRLPNKLAQKFSEWRGIPPAISTPAATAVTTKALTVTRRSADLSAVPFAAKSAFKRAVSDDQKVVAKVPKRSLPHRVSRLTSLLGGRTPGQLRTDLSTKIDASRIAMGCCLRRRRVFADSGFVSDATTSSEGVRTTSRYLESRMSRVGLQELLERSPVGLQQLLERTQGRSGGEILHSRLPSASAFGQL